MTFSPEKILAASFMRTPAFVGTTVAVELSRDYPPIVGCDVHAPLASTVPIAIANASAAAAVCAEFAPVRRDELSTCDNRRAITHAVNTKTACNRYRSITERDWCPLKLHVSLDR
jgi:hypothetical protein